ncbi:TIGR00730 family Rossman fold protein [Streptomyces sp. NPDC005925]|uniref:LOG family protein n=1 Tax=Streptomyces sp. NPDC005925 TaxID=3157172 RepID=UPI0033C780B5
MSHHLLPPLSSDNRQPKLGSVAAFTGSALGSSEVLVDAVGDFGKCLVDQGITLVYGGGRVGMMGVLADAVLGAGGKAIGVMPRNLIACELAHDGLTDLHVVDSMHERKARMAELADAFVALPGGAGTLEEFFEAWTWGQLGIHVKPVALLNVADCWMTLLTALNEMVERGFLAQRHLDSLVVAQDSMGLLALLRTWTPPVAKWT